MVHSGHLNVVKSPKWPFNLPQGGHCTSSVDGTLGNRMSIGPVSISVVEACSTETAALSVWLCRYSPDICSSVAIEPLRSNRVVC